MPVGGGAVREIGLISDTHGLLRPEVIPALGGCDLIVHAGDVGDASILEALRSVAPVVAVRGNTDGGALGAALPDTEWIQAGGRTLYLIHIREHLDLDPSAAGVDAVVYGHTHRPVVEERHGVLFVNPGSCGPRRFDLPVTVARLTTGPGEMRVRLIPIATGARADTG
ncbi:MAG: metallophosphoesterase family protein [Longimicrobiales bacterium]|nr:metallophosphoesterase family protein [Longimicrobiales bacterium]